MSDDKPTTEDDSPHENPPSDLVPNNLAAESIDWASALAACPGPVFGYTNGRESGPKVTISGDQVARRVDLIRYMMSRNQLSPIEAEGAVWYAIESDLIGAIWDYQVVFQFDNENEDQG